MIDPDLLGKSVPACLRERDQWVCWRYVERKGNKTKCPVDAKNNRFASSTDARTWCTFEEALSALQHRSGLAGIGFVFTPDDPFAGVDLDGCVIDSEIVPEAWAVVARLDSYAEFSPSGRGVKVFIQASKALHFGCRSADVAGFDHIELYDRSRFFAVTGRHVPGTPNVVCNRQTELKQLCSELWPQADHAPKAQSVSDNSEVLQAAPPIDMAARETRCTAYVEKCPDAISGQGGHDATLRAACECFRFGLDDAAVWRVMRQFNDAKTGNEQWSDKELAHKIDSARSKVEAAGEWGIRLTDLESDASTMRDDQIATLMTDVGNAARLGRRYGQEIRFCYGVQQWLIWDGRRWKPDDRGKIIKFCKETALGILDEAKLTTGQDQQKLLGWAMASQRRERLVAMSALAQPELSVGPDDLDADPWALNCSNGTIDLRTGKLRPHSKDDLITKLVPIEFDPNAACEPDFCVRRVVCQEQPDPA